MDGEEQVSLAIDGERAVQPVADRGEDIGVVVYVGAAANVLEEIRKQHCLGRTPGSVLREQLASRGRSAAHLHSGRWRCMPCTSLDEAIDLRSYLVQRLRPALNKESSPWKREYSVLYHSLVQELNTLEALGCDELEATFAGPGVYVYYHGDALFWQSDAESPQGKSLSESRLLKKAIALSRGGDTRPAREILAHVISANPRNELAWLWYAYNLATNLDRIKVLEECLRHNPESKEAKDRLVYLQTSEALRLRVEERRGEIQLQIAQAEARLRGLREGLLQGEEAVRQAEESYESARARVEQTRREISVVTAELEQLCEQLTAL